MSDEDLAWRELLGHLLEYHRREARQEWWQFFKRQDARVEELIADSDCIGGLTVDTSVPPRQEKRSRAWTLRFPEQEFKLGAGDKVVRADTGEGLEIMSLDERALTLELKVGPSREALIDGISLIPSGPMDDTKQREAIVRYAEAVLTAGENEYSAITSIIRRDPPRLAEGVILNGGISDLLAATVDAVGRMDHSHLVIQGPPGTGKTFTSAHAIVELLKNGKRVGVTAMTHKAINNLLCEVEKVAEDSVVVKIHGCEEVHPGDARQRSSAVRSSRTPTRTRSQRATNINSWPAPRGSFHDRSSTATSITLFVDEAGQMAIARASCRVA